MNFNLLSFLFRKKTAPPNMASNDFRPPCPKPQVQKSQPKYATPPSYRRDVPASPPTDSGLTDLLLVEALMRHDSTSSPSPSTPFSSGGGGDYGGGGASASWDTSSDSSSSSSDSSSSDSGSSSSSD